MKIEVTELHFSMFGFFASGDGEGGGDEGGVCGRGGSDDFFLCEEGCNEELNFSMFVFFTSGGGDGVGRGVGGGVCDRGGGCGGVVVWWRKW